MSLSKRTQYTWITTVINQAIYDVPSSSVSSVNSSCSRPALVFTILNAIKPRWYAFPRTLDAITSLREIQVREVAQYNDGFDLASDPGPDLGPTDMFHALGTTIESQHSEIFLYMNLHRRLRRRGSCKRASLLHYGHRFQGNSRSWTNRHVSCPRYDDREPAQWDISLYESSSTPPTQRLM